MMINNVNFHNLGNQKYWAPPASWPVQKKKDIVRNRIFSGDWAGACKKDGSFYKFIKNSDGTMELLGRSKGVAGDYLDKIEWIPQCQDFFSSLPNGTCLIGEVYFPNNEGSKNTTSIMGCLKDKAIQRQASGEKLHYYIFDVLAYNNQIYYTLSMKRRIEILSKIESNNKCQYIEFAKYYTGKKLWAILQEVLASGGEGCVITRLGSCYQPDKRPSKDCMKVKKELSDTIDCFFTGRIAPPTKEYTGKSIETWPYWYNTRTDKKLSVSETGNYYERYCHGEPIIPVTTSFYNNWAGSLEIGVLKDNSIIPIGMLSGLTQEIKANPGQYKGRPIEVQAMEIGYDENGKFSGLRHAKFLQFRDDITYEDCTWEKFMNEHQ